MSHKTENRLMFVFVGLFLIVLPALTGQWTNVAGAAGVFGMLALLYWQKGEI